MNNIINTHRKSDGVTLVEVIISIFVLTLISTGLASVFKLVGKSISDGANFAASNTLDSILERTFVSDVAQSKGIVIASVTTPRHELLCTSWISDSNLLSTRPLATIYLNNFYAGYEIRNNANGTSDLWRVGCNSIGSIPKIISAIKIVSGLPNLSNIEWTENRHFGLIPLQSSNEQIKMTEFADFVFPSDRYIALARNDVIQYLTVGFSNSQQPTISVTDASDLVAGMFVQSYQTDSGSNWITQFTNTSTIASISNKDISIIGNTNQLNAQVNWSLKFYSPFGVQFNLPRTVKFSERFINATVSIG